MVTREQTLSATLIEFADTLVSDYDLIDYLDRLLERSIEVLAASAGGVMLSNGDAELQLLVSTNAHAPDGAVRAAATGRPVR